MRTPRPHRPGRPHWRCTACGCPYPCGPARILLLARHDGDRLTLAIDLAEQMLDAATDWHRLGHAISVPGLHPRFLGWLRPRRSTPDP